MSFKAVLVKYAPLYADIVERYKQVFPSIGADFDVKNCLSEDDIIDFASDADTIIVVAQPITRKVIAGLSNCKLIMNIGIGFDSIDVAAATELGICVANVPDASVEEVSDHTMGLILACSRGIVKLDRAARAGKWQPIGVASEIRMMWPSFSRLRGQTLGLVGFGRVPRILVPKAKGFGMSIVAYDPYVAQEKLADMDIEKANLNDLLEKSDFVSVHCALTAETRHLLGTEQFARMKATAWLINTARGGVVDYNALYTAISEGKLAGAALDVTEPEPLPPDSPLLDLDNVVVTAHSAHASPQSQAENWERPIDEIKRIINGMWPAGLVNPDVKDTYARKWGAPLK